MKFLVVLALFALAAAEPEAEADPYFYYHTAAYQPYNYGYHYPYTYGWNYPYNYGHYALPVAKPVEPVVKEAEPVEKAEVKVEEPKAVVPTYVPYTYTHPYAYNYPAVTYGALKPYHYYANSGGAVHIVKREAEAEADPKSWYSHYGYHYPNYYSGYYGYNSYYRPYTYGYHGYPYTYGRYYYGK